MTEKKVNKSWLPIAVTAIFLFLIASGIAIFNEKEVIPEGYLSPQEIQGGIERVTQEVSSEKDLLISDLNTQISDLNTQLSEKVEEIAEEVEEAVKEASGYLIDKIFFSDSLNNLKLSDREVKTLFDDEIRFDGEDYDAEEVLTLNGLEVLCNEEDFNGDAYLTIPTNSISYKLVFENSLNTSLITDEETLEFSFLGEEIEVSEWDGINKITLSKGEEILMSQEETKTIGEKVFTLLYVMEDSIFVDVDGETKEINEGKTKTVNELEIEVRNVIYSEAGEGIFKAVLVLGEEVTTDINNGDEYSEDSIWEYEITAHSIGIVLKEEFMELDDELLPLKAEETICLPNDYVCIRYNGVIEEEFEDISFDLDTKNTVDYVEIKGNFQSGLEDFDKLYVNSSSIYDEDLVQITGTIMIGNSDLIISANTNRILIEDSISGDYLLRVNLDLDNVQVDKIGTWNDISSIEEDFRTIFGILITEPKDSCEDNEFDLSIPNERLENTITVL